MCKFKTDNCFSLQFIHSGSIGMVKYIGFTSTYLTCELEKKSVLFLLKCLYYLINALP